MRLSVFILAAASAIAAEPPLLVFSSYHGGDREDQATAVAVDSAGNTFIAGQTESKNFPGTPTGQPGAISAVTNSYLTKVNPTGDKVLWSLMIGGSSATRINAAATDAEGNVYVTGRTGSRNFPLLKAVQTTQPGLNIGFLQKYDADGKLLFSTYLGGERNDEPNAIALDSQGNIYVAGRTNSSTFPTTPNTLAPKAPGGGDAFIAKFTPDYQLAWSTYYGGTGADEIFGIAIGPEDSLYVVGETYSPNLATADTWQSRYITMSGFVARISPAGDAVLSCSYIGGRGGYTVAQAVAVDWAGNTYVSGYTSVKDLPTTDGAIQPKYAGGMRDAFVLKLSPDFHSALYLTYLGGSFSGKSDPDETAPVLKLDSHGFVYVAGDTSSPDFPTHRAVQPDLRGDQDAYVIRLDLDNSRIVSSTFWGGAQRDTALALTLGPDENFTFTGLTFSNDLTTKVPFRAANAGTGDSFATRLCDPWLTANPGAIVFNYTIGQPLPDPQELQVSSGCTVAHEIAEAVSSEGWVVVTPDRAPRAATLKLLPNFDGMAAGEYKATITVNVPQAANGPLQLPVTLIISDPPPPPSDEAN